MAKAVKYDAEQYTQCYEGLRKASAQQDRGKYIGKCFTAEWA